MYHIAGLNVSVLNGRTLFESRAEEYRIDKPVKADLVIDAANADFALIHSMNTQLTLEECAYICTCDEFGVNLLDYGGFRLHASAVALDGRAYLFSANSGVGKSTHTALWCQHFGMERTCIINDDMPLVKWEGDSFYAWGSPWSGTSPLNRNLGVPLQAIAFLERSQTDQIERLDNATSLSSLMLATRMGLDPVRLDKLMNLLERLLNTVPIFRLRCTPTISAVQTAFTVMAR